MSRLLRALAVLALLPGPALARPVAVELVLALDVSSSVDDREYRLQLDGLATALRSPDVAKAAAAAAGGVAITVVQWASAGDQRQVVPWTLIVDAAALAAMAARVERLDRAHIWGVTALGDAIAAAHALFANNGFEGGQRVIDVSGDGRSNLGRPLAGARAAALADGVTINALAMVNEEPELEAYYRAELIGGPGAFVMVAASYADFARAMQAKLIREIAGTGVADASADR